MSYRLEDQGLTIRLFRDQQEAAKSPGAHTPVEYAFGWLVRNGAGRYIDAHGMLPADWKPSVEHLKK